MSQEEADADLLRETIDKLPQTEIDRVSADICDRYGPMMALVIAGKHDPSVKVAAIGNMLARYILRRDRRRDAERGVHRD